MWRWKKGNEGDIEPPTETNPDNNPDFLSTPRLVFSEDELETNIVKKIISDDDRDNGEEGKVAWEGEYEEGGSTPKGSVSKEVPLDINFTAAANPVASNPVFTRRPSDLIVPLDATAANPVFVRRTSGLPPIAAATVAVADAAAAASTAASEGLGNPFLDSLGECAQLDFHLGPDENGRNPATPPMLTSGARRVGIVAGADAGGVGTGGQTGVVVKGGTVDEYALLAGTVQSFVEEQPENTTAGAGTGSKTNTVHVTVGSA